MSDKSKILELLLSEDERNTRLAIEINEGTNSFKTLASFTKKYKNIAVYEFKMYKLITAFRKEADLSNYEYDAYTLIDVLQEDFDFYSIPSFISYNHLILRLYQGLTLQEFFHCTTRESRLALKAYKIEAKCKLHKDLIPF